MSLQKLILGCLCVCVTTTPRVSGAESLTPALRSPSQSETVQLAMPSGGFFIPLYPWVDLSSIILEFGEILFLSPVSIQGSDSMTEPINPAQVELERDCSEFIATYEVLGVRPDLGEEEIFRVDELISQATGLLEANPGMVDIEIETRLRGVFLEIKSELGIGGVPDAR